MAVTVDEKLVARMAPDLRPLARELLPHLDVPGLPPERAVAYVAAAAAAFKEVQDERSAEALPPVPVSPQDEVRMEQVEPLLRPSAEAVRREVFGSPAPPFGSLEEAAAWITDEYARSRQQEAAVTNYMGDCVNAMLQAHVTTAAPHDYDAFSIEVDPREAQLRYIGANGWVEGCGAMGSAKLTRLAWASETMTKASGWDEPAQATTYLLLGIASPIPHITISTSVTLSGQSPSAKDRLRRREAVLTIRGSDFSYAELREIWDRLRRKGVTEKKPLTRKHAEVWRFVTARREQGVPWQQILDEWNRSHGEDDQYKTIRGLRFAHRRAEEKGLMAADFFEIVEDVDPGSSLGDDS